MDCSSALELLDCVRPSSDDLALPELAEARAHLESCPACQQEFAHRQQFDLAVANAMHAVPVPVGLEGRLQSALQTQAAPSADVPTEAPAANTSRKRRRGGFKWAAVVVAVVLAISLWPNSESLFTVEHTLRVVQTDLATATPFDGSFETRLPSEWNHPGLRWMTDWRGQNLDDRPGDEVALRVFRFTSRKGAVVDGMLAMLPANRVGPQPQDSSFTRAALHYPARDGHKFVAAAWREQDTVFLCLVPDSAADLELLQRLLGGLAA